MSRGKSTDTIFSNVMGKGSKGEESMNKPVTFLHPEGAGLVCTDPGNYEAGIEPPPLSPSVYCSSGSETGCD